MSLENDINRFSSQVYHFSNHAYNIIYVSLSTKQALHLIRQLLVTPR